MNHIKACCESIAQTGFGTLQISEAMLLDYKKIVDGYPAISPATKASFSFEKDTDGFFPFGAEYSSLEEQPDLCERFCYWPAHSLKRRAFEFTRSDFFAAVTAFEQQISELAQGLMDGICAEFGATSLNSLRAASYLQLCVYGANSGSGQRQFAQDPHEDGHLLSFIKPTRDGLVLVRGSSLEPVRLLENEVAILAGSLLTELSDCAIPAAYHAVLTPRRPMPRSSLIYFVNPDSEQELTSFFRHQPIDLKNAADTRHTSFGNHPLQLI
ncbi:2OG-Fe(II) oxygenase [Pseudomonas sp. S1Bt30]|uniref:2OG-Fe(II) oxygenase n=1 Tax=Pseudomonas quebecensis TaxID=2995174 RepID=A0ABY6QFX7_9PSED|nr:MULTISPECIES: 2OG-Fe(II) oxygenase [Pseudomonas]MCX4065296.1 2OG-Fe(II) oxygenase [Pseudomonas quebecensis]UZW18877.1 2OG-Fe(II) oxygenase [Pseudomonas quebecensis]UZW23708.1 2OG-Fe(II) oxygenase [Pseudomonas quebecensis]UZW28770.1 2OG-Fe(II) oxygenase [Pseudomonas quebecensis]